MHLHRINSDVYEGNRSASEALFLRQAQKRLEAAPAREWNPRHVDLEQDKKDFQSLNPEQQKTLIRFLAQNLYGEEAVKDELGAIRRYVEKRYGKDSKQATFVKEVWIPDEARHEGFARLYLEQVCGVKGEDLNISGARRYKQIFDRVLHDAMQRLDRETNSEGCNPAREERFALTAFSIYTAFVENTVAVPAFSALFSALDGETAPGDAPKLPGLREGINRFVEDEVHHVGFGKDFLLLCSQLHGRSYARRYAVIPVLRYLPLALLTVNEFFKQDKKFPFKVSRGSVIRHAIDNINGSFEGISRRNEANIATALAEGSLPVGWR